MNYLSNELENVSIKSPNERKEYANMSTQSQNESKESQNEQIKDFGQVIMNNNSNYKIELLSIIGEVEGH